jgi:hypothetical protein
MLLIPSIFAKKNRLESQADANLRVATLASEKALRIAPLHAIPTRSTPSG